MFYSIRQRYSLSIIACLCILFNSLPAFTSQTKGRRTSVVVRPIFDGEGDVESENLAKEISHALSISKEFRIINCGNSCQLVDVILDPAEHESDYQKAISSLEEAKKDYMEFKYKKAMDKLQRNISFIESKTETIGSLGHVLQDSYVFMACMAKSKGSKGSARRFLIQAIKLDPGIKISQEQYPPSFIEFFDEIKISMACLNCGKLKVKSKPSGADVYINGIFKGASPLFVDSLPENNYHVSIRSKKYYPVEKRVDVFNGRTVSSKVKLKKKDDDNGKRPLSSEEELRLGVAVAENMEADKVVLIDVKDVSGSDYSIKARMIDRMYGTGHVPIQISNSTASPERPRLLAQMVDSLVKQSKTNMTEGLDAVVDNGASTDPIVLKGSKKSITKSPIFWSAIGLAVAGAIAGGVVAATSQSSSQATGSIRVRFK